MKEYLPSLLAILFPSILFVVALNMQYKVFKEIKTKNELITYVWAGIYSVVFIISMIWLSRSMSSINNDWKLSSSELADVMYTSGPLFFTVLMLTLVFRPVGVFIGNYLDWLFEKIKFSFAWIKWPFSFKKKK